MKACKEEFFLYFELFCRRVSKTSPDSKETKVFGCKRVDVNVIIIWIILDNKKTKLLKNHLKFGT